MWQLLLPLALWLGTMGLGRAELTAAQLRGLQVALEEFHKHPPVQWAFRETGVNSAMDTVSGTPGRGGGRDHCTGVQHVPQEQMQKCLGPVSTQLSGERPRPQPPPGMCCFKVGQVTSRKCSAGSAGCWPSCLSAALPGRDLCEAGI